MSWLLLVSKESKTFLFDPNIPASSDTKSLFGVKITFFKE